MNPEISAQIDLIQKLIDSGPTVKSNKYNQRGDIVGTKENRLVTFGYIGNLSSYKDDRCWMVFDNSSLIPRTKWSCESNSLTVEKLEEAYKVAEEAIKKAWQFVNDTP